MVRSLLLVAVWLVPAVSLILEAGRQDKQHNHAKMRHGQGGRGGDSFKHNAEGRAVLDMDSSADSHFGADATLRSDSESTVTFSPEERLALHSQKFEAEFMVELDMSAAHDEGKSIGIVLDMDTDFNPVSVMKVRKTGLMETWNKEHPDKEVHVGDEIVKVNDILWHHNSRTFAQRIKSQFQASREYKEGAKRILSLGIQRPRRQREVRFASQREDLHHQLYSKDYSIELPLKLGRSMGWQLNSSVSWLPISIAKIRSNGLVAEWNAEHPEAKIYAGDEILQVNQIQWHHNSDTFEDRINAQFVNAQRNRNITSLLLRFQRPRSVQEVLEPQTFYKEINVSLPLKIQNATSPGWTLNSNQTDLVSIDDISPGGLVALWNEANPEKRLQVGDHLFKVGRFVMLKNVEPKKFAHHVAKEFEASSANASAQETVELVVRRQEVRTNIKEWIVNLPAVDGQILGWQLNSADDSWPVVVSKIRNLGAVPTWNQLHPDARILPGDQIVKVNDILWRQDSSDFERSVNEQYTKSKKVGTMMVFLRRFQEEQQSEDTRPFAKEFSVELEVGPGKTMGWQLSTDDNETVPMLVQKVRKVGAVAEWNDKHPLDEVMVGDRIVKANNILWHWNTKTFTDRMNGQLELARKGKGKTTMTFLIQRPWKSEGDAGGRKSAGGIEEDGAVGAEDDSVGGGEDDVMGAME